MRAQEAEIEKSRSGADTRDHQEGESERHLSGSVHRWCCFTKTDRDMQVRIKEHLLYA